MIAIKTLSIANGRHEDAQMIFDGIVTPTNRWVYPSGVDNNAATKALKHKDAQKLKTS